MGRRNIVNSLDIPAETGGPHGPQYSPPHCPPPSDSPVRELAASSNKLGPPLSIGTVAAMLGCSPWTVRQALIPRGLPHFRFAASGKLVFYTHQIERWIESQQFEGGQRHK